MVLKNWLSSPVLRIWIRFDGVSGFVKLDTGGACCPLSRALFTDPVCAPDGYTYERDAIATWRAVRREFASRDGHAAPAMGWRAGVGDGARPTFPSDDACADVRRA